MVKLSDMDTFEDLPISVVEFFEPDYFTVAVERVSSQS